MQGGRLEPACRKKATAADIHGYVNDQRSTSAEPKLEAAEVEANWAPDEIRHGSVQPFQPTLLRSGELSL